MSIHRLAEILHRIESFSIDLDTLEGHTDTRRAVHRAIDAIEDAIKAHGGVWDANAGRYRNGTWNAERRVFEIPSSTPANGDDPFFGEALCGQWLRSCDFGKGNAAKIVYPRQIRELHAKGEATYDRTQDAVGTWSIAGEVYHYDEEQ